MLKPVKFPLSCCPCLFFFIFPVFYFPLCGKIFVLGNQFPQSFFYNIPVQKHFCIRISITAFFQTDTLAVMVMMGIIIPRQTTGTSANPIFIFQKCYVFLFVMPLCKIIINAKRSIGISTSPSKGIVNLILCDEILLLYLQCIRQRELQFFPVKVCNL